MTSVRHISQNKSEDFFAIHIDKSFSLWYYIYVMKQNSMINAHPKRGAS